jgi:hypothetical protein
MREPGSRVIETRLVRVYDSKIVQAPHGFEDSASQCL